MPLQPPLPTASLPAASIFACFECFLATLPNGGNYQGNQHTGGNQQTARRLSLEWFAERRNTVQFQQATVGGDDAEHDDRDEIGQARQ